MTNKPSRALVRGYGHEPVFEPEAHYVSEPEGLDFGDIFRMFRRNWWIIVVTTLVAIGIAAYVVSREVQTYTSIAVIRLVDREGGEVSSSSGGGSSSPKGVGGSSDPLLSEIMVLKGRSVMEKAVDQGGLRLFSAGAPATVARAVAVDVPPQEKGGAIRIEFGDPDFSYEHAGTRRTAAYGDSVEVAGVRFVVPSKPEEERAVLQVVPRDVAVKYLSGKVEAKSRTGTSVIDVAFKSGDPKVGTRVVNDVVKAYQVVNADLARQNVRRRRTFLEEQLARTDSLQREAQANLSGHRSQELAYSAKDRFSTEQSNLIDVEIQQAELQANLEMYESVLNRILQAGGSNDPSRWSDVVALPEVSGLVQELHDQLVSYLEEREEELAGPWSKAPTHPDIQRLDSLIASTQDRLVSAVRSHINGMRSQIATLGRIRGQAATRMSDLPSSEVEEMWLTQNLEALQETGDMLREEYYAVRLEEAGEAGQVEIVELATGATADSSGRAMKLGLGLLSGLLLGGALAIGRDKLSSSIHDPEEIESMLLVPNLAVIPETKALLAVPSRAELEKPGRKKKNGQRSLSATTLRGLEAYRILRTNLLFSESIPDFKTLLVTSAAPGEGKTMTAFNLSAAFAHQGFRVLLIESDLRRPDLGELFGWSNGSGLSSVFEENRHWRTAVRSSGLQGLDVLLAGGPMPKPSEHLASSAMQQLLQEASEAYDKIIIDSSPVLIAADASILGAMSDGVLVVVRASRADRAAVQRSIQQLSMVGARVVGTVLNDPDETVDRRDGGYDDYYEYVEAQDEGSP